jgi:hypothetical protein
MRDFIQTSLQVMGFAILALSYAIDAKLALHTKILSVCMASVSAIGIIAVIVMAWKLRQ